MVIITNKSEYVKFDFSAFTTRTEVDYIHLYIMKDQVYCVKLSKNLDFVEVHTPSEILEFDMNNKKGLPANVLGKVPLNNTQLAEELAKLKDL